MKRNKRNWIKDLKSKINKMPPTVFNRNEIGELYNELRENDWLPITLNNNDFIKELITKNIIKAIEINYIGSANSIRKKMIRYNLNSSPYSVGLSLRSKSYVSHESALYLHGIIKSIPKRIYVNMEQSKKKNNNELSQKGLDRAFKGKPRRSNYLWSWDDYNFVLLNGKNCENYGVENLEIENKEIIRVTSIERTMVDILVRPIYSGGLNTILNAYKYINKNCNISVDKILEILNRFDYTYPYHQSIGFMMENTGFDKEQISLLKKEGMKFDFYLDYRIKNMVYDVNWKMHYPKDLFMK